MATGVLTLLGACNALASTIRKLHNLREAPKELEALEEEVSALQLCTDGVNHLLHALGRSSRDVMAQTFIGDCVEKARLIWRHYPLNIAEAKPKHPPTAIDKPTASDFRTTVSLELCMMVSV